jgi:dipeptidyl aminopeptidase/acylaminoacyl peptidase
MVHGLFSPLRIKTGKRLWTRSLQSTAAEKVLGTEGAANPFWSADSQAIGFFAKGKLMKVDPSHGLSQALSDVADQRGGAWNKTGVILFAPDPYDGLFRINNTGGVPSKVTVTDASMAEVTHRFPYFLPDGKHFLFFVKSQKGEGGVYIGSLDSQQKSFLLNSDRSAVYSSGYLLFQRANTLFAQPFDVNKLKLSGEAIPLSENVWYEPQTWGTRGVFVADNNLLTYVEGSNLSQLQWFDRTGKQLGLISSVDQYAGAPAFSPDGKRFAISVVDGGYAHVWLYDTASGSRSRLTFSRSYNVNSRWSPDGKQIMFSSTRDGLFKLFVRDSDGTGNDELLFQSKDACLSDDWSPTGQYIVFSQVNSKTKYDLWILQLGQQKKAFPFLQTEANESHARFSADGNWIAYCSDESGQPEIYVQPFTAKKGGKWQISTSGGFNPKWSKDGKELFYLSLDNQIMSSEVKIGSIFEATVPKPLFAIHPYTMQRIGSQSYSAFEPEPDGPRIAVHSSLTSSPPNITVVLNWTQLLNPNK